jgi:tetratricopeptide (TPR) repeat protein
MAIPTRHDVLEQARMAILSGDYFEGLHLVESLLRNCHSDAEALCLKGNALELLVFSERQSEPNIQSASYDERLIQARQCFEKALSLNPKDTHAMRDLADHLKGTGDKASALKLYEQLIDLLSVQLALGEAVEDELSDAVAEREELI